MTGLAKAMNLVNPEIEHHHEQTAYLSLFIARHMGLPEEDVILTLYSALLHDIGSIIVDEPQTVTEVEQNALELSLTGARMLEDIPGCEEIAEVVRYSQCSWVDTVHCAVEEGETCERYGRIASIVHLSDTVSLLLDPEERVLNQANRITGIAKYCSGTQFSPEAVDAFIDIAQTEYVWMDLMHNPMFLTYFTGEIAPVSLEDAIWPTLFMSRIIDYRSAFTAMHSAGVAASATELARLAGMPEEDVLQMRIAGYLHDVGKLAVPRSILEKPGKLTTEEFNIVKEHPYYTSLVLLGIDGFEKIGHWAANHHEKLEGNGYPFHYPGDALDAGDRIMAVADVFSAITEERPYRKGMPREKALGILREDVESKALCGDIVSLLAENYERVDAARDEASRKAGKRYFESFGNAK